MTTKRRHRWDPDDHLRERVTLAGGFAAPDGFEIYRQEGSPPALVFKGSARTRPQAVSLMEGLEAGLQSSADADMGVKAELPGG